MVHVLKRSQLLPIRIEQAWGFFSDPHNLNEITPPDVSFQFQTQELPKEVYPGLMIQYRIKLFGVSVNWVTEITHVERPYYFVDEQRLGPYAIWHHEHRFEEVDGGVEMTDLVHYKMPFAFIGEIMRSLVVARKLQKIFDFRMHMLTMKFK